jgi:protein-S-isoprenylcysteine O-methyltransferase Ste14
MMLLTESRQFGHKLWDRTVLDHDAQPKMKNLILKSFVGLIFLLIVMSTLLFIPAGTLNYWQAWVFLVVFGGSSLIITLYLMKNDSKLLEKRVVAGPTAEKLTSEKIIQSITSVWFIAMLVIPAIGRRLHWSFVLPSLSVLGDIFLAISFYIIFLVFKENSFTSATIELQVEQKVISTGLYRFVRHPMYMGAFLLFVGMSLALGSWWDFALFAIVMPALIWRLLDEEKFLAKNLQGYKEYQKKVKYHLIPLVW